MDSTQSDADKIRAKRLAKLGGQGGASTPPATQSGADQQQNGPSPNVHTTDGASEKQSTPSIPQDNPFSKLAHQVPAQPEADKKPAPSQITVKPRALSPPKRERDGTERPRSRATERQPESLEAWQDRSLRQIFRVTLKEGETKDAHNNSLFFLGSTKQDLEESGAQLLLNTEVLEGAITEAAGQAGGKIFEYLLQCFKRVSRAIRGGKFSGPEDPKRAVLEETRRLCMSYCIFAVTMPEMFGDNVPTSNPLVDHLLADPECDVGICTDFLTEATSRFEEDDSIKEAIVGAAEELSRQLSGQDMLGNYQPYVRGMRNLLRFTKIVEAVTLSPMWAPDVPAQEIESKTLLGPFFRISPMQQTVANSYFPTPRTKDRAAVANAQNAVRMTLRTHESELFEIANTVIRTGPAPRERMLNWFAACVNKNHKKRAMRVDRKTVSSDGFMMNVTHILDQLCDPFMDAKFAKIDRIDVDYLRRNPRVDISDETKINADQKTSDEFYSHKAEGTNNFISEVFFLTVAAHHYGAEAAQTRVALERKTVKRWEKDLEAMEAERHKYINDPRYLRAFETRLAQFKKAVDDMWSNILATEGVLFDDLTQARSMQFMRYVIVWVLRIASGQNLPKEQVRLPLPEEQSLTFRCLPEYFLEDVVDNFKYITQWLPHIITPQQSEEIVQFCVAFLRCSDYVKNPGVKSGLVTILFYGVFEFQRGRPGVLRDILIGSPFAHRHLLHALMRYYIEAENTGTHNQFYDKFTIRYEIFQVIKAIWINTLYRENLAKEAEVNTEFFVQFVNMLVNDATYVLDECLSSFAKIHELTKELSTQSILQDLSQEQRKEKEELLDDHKGKAKNYMGLTKESMETLILFTETLAGAFTMNEIVTRLADMLDYNLDTLTGAKRKNIKVENPQDYGFNPKHLLGDLVSVFINLSSKDSFIRAIARDGRSYKPENFHEATRILSVAPGKSPEELRIWNELARKVEAAKLEIEEEEADLGDIPEEFLDPITADLMTDPVILPVSRETMDRAAIKSHLLSVGIDPFNRAPLKLEDVIPNDELREKIRKWKEERLREMRAQKAERMDTSEG